ncbi:MAG TPA: DUF6786 family protein, partial [Spirochaetia bacterium]
MREESRSRHRAGRAELLTALRAAGIDAVLLGDDDGWAVVAPSLGARILAAGVDDENALWTAPRIARAAWADGGNVGGQRTWIAPEGGPRGFFFRTDPGLWTVPEELDPGGYVEVPGTDGWRSWECRFTARCLDGESFPVSLTRSVRIARGERGPVRLARVQLRQTLTNRGGTALDRRIGLWSIAQCPCGEGGRIVLTLAPDHGPSCVRPSFAPLLEGVLEMRPEAAVLRTVPGVKYKVGCDAHSAAGGVAFVGPRGGEYLLVALLTDVDREGTYLDRPVFGGEVPCGDAIQAYNDPGTGGMAFCELETHAPALRLAPGGSQQAEVSMVVAFG